MAVVLEPRRYFYDGFEVPDPPKFRPLSKFKYFTKLADVIQIKIFGLLNFCEIVSLKRVTDEATWLIV